MGTPGTDGGGGYVEGLATFDGEVGQQLRCKSAARQGTPPPHGEGCVFGCKKRRKKGVMVGINW